MKRLMKSLVVLFTVLLLLIPGNLAEEDAASSFVGSYYLGVIWASRKIQQNSLMKKVSGRDVRIKEAELSKEKENLIYKVKTEEKRKILGLFTVTAEKDYELDAVSEDADVISEDAPWWYGMSSSAE